MNVELVIFDLDGTILYTLEDLAAALNYTLSFHGYPKRTLEEARAFVGNGIRKLIQRSVPPGDGRGHDRPPSSNLFRLL